MVGRTELLTVPWPDGGQQWSGTFYLVRAHPAQCGIVGGCKGVLCGMEGRPMHGEPMRSSSTDWGQVDHFNCTHGLSPGNNPTASPSSRFANRVVGLLINGLPK